MKTSLVVRSLTLLSGLTVLMAPSLMAQDSWTPELSMQYRAILDTALSPDGALVAYVVRTPLMEGENSEYQSHIWVAAADGSWNAQYTQGDNSCTNPAFSPDGSMLAFTTSRSGKNQVWVMRVRGGEAEQITEAGPGVGAFAWSPDGTRLAYTMRDPETEEEKQRKKEKRDVILVDQDFKNSHLYVLPMTPDEEGTRTAEQVTEGDFHVTGFDWSPDGQRIVFAHQPDPRINTSRSGNDLSVVALDTEAVRPLVARPGADGNPHYSPDGQWVAFVSHGGTPEPVGLGDVYVVPATGGTPRKLADTPNRQAGLLGWTGDGTAVLITESIRTSRQVMALPVVGRNIRFLTTTEGVVGSPSFNGDATQMAFTYQNTTTPVEVFHSPTSGFERTQVSAVNADVPRPRMGRTAVVTWLSPDSTEVEGLLTYPVDYTPGRQYPLILQIHGGPAGVFSQSFTGNPGIYMTQVFAQQGYAVLRPNPRGSTGYGKDFRYANVKDWGYGDYEDVMSGVDKAIAMGLGHPDSLAVMGWSYGGYLTSFTVTRTDRFKAASMGAGLPNLISMVTTTDIPDYLVGHMGGEFWDDYEGYERHSAMYRIKNVVTPTQVIHGENDLRVPFTQGQEFYVALQRRGVETEMVVYPRTPHGPREPKLLMDVTPRILTWFDQHLRQGNPEIVQPVR